MDKKKHAFPYVLPSHVVLIIVFPRRYHAVDRFGGKALTKNIRHVLAHPDQRLVAVRSAGPFRRLELQVVVHELHLPLHKTMNGCLNAENVSLFIPEAYVKSFIPGDSGLGLG